MECPICLEALGDRDGVTLNCCAQRLHAPCYVRTVQANPACPLCRAKHDVRIEVSEEVQVPSPSQCAQCLRALGTATMYGFITVFIVSNFQRC